MLIRISFFLLLCLLITPTWVQAEKQQPNILFILTDQWRAQSIGYAGNEQVKTPILMNWRVAASTLRTPFPAAPSAVPFERHS